MKPIRPIFAAPMMSIAMLIGISAERVDRVTPLEAAPYQARAKLAIDSIPRVVGTWTATPEEVSPEVIRLLHPNAIADLKYVDNSASAGAADRVAILLIDQCPDARNMYNHWPPNCYPNSGETETFAQKRDWKVGSTTLHGVEYHFSKTTALQSTRRAVYNFLVVPDRGIVRDMRGVRAAASDYQRRYYGVAQFQVVMNADLPRAERDDIFKTLMRPCLPAIKLLMTGDKTK